MSASSAEAPSRPPAAPRTLTTRPTPLLKGALLVAILHGPAPAGPLVLRFARAASVGLGMAIFEAPDEHHAAPLAEAPAERPAETHAATLVEPLAAPHGGVR